jgi:hypothetical protein
MRGQQAAVGGETGQGQLRGVRLTRGRRKPTLIERRSPQQKLSHRSGPQRKVAGRGFFRVAAGPPLRPFARAVSVPHPTYNCAKGLAMLVTGWLCWLKNGSRPRAPARRRRRGSGLHERVRDWPLEDRCLLAMGGAPVTFPVPTVSSVGQVLYNGVSGTYQKTITITNNSPTQTIYAFLEGVLTRQAVASYQGTAAFDPFDPSNQEYRAYIGYTDGTNNYAGLPPLSAITITVPLAFWDSGRIIFSTDGADQFSTYGGAAGGSVPGAPFYYHDMNMKATFY